MDLVTPLMQTLQANANLEHTESVTQDTRALAQQRLLNTQMLGINIQRQQNTMQALQQYFSGQSPTDPSMEPAPGDTALQASQKNLARMQRDANFARGAAVAIAKAGGDLASVDKMMDNATQASHWAAYAAREAMQERGKQAQDVANIAIGVNDDASAAAAYQQLATLDPQMAKMLNLDRDANGNVVYGANTYTTMQTLTHQGISAAKQAELAQKVIDAKRKQLDADTRAEAEKRKALETESVIARNQGAANASNATAGLRGAQTTAVVSGKSTKPLTQPEQRINAQIDQARTEMAGISDADLPKYFDAFSQETLRNPNMQQTIHQAATRKYGEDPDYEGVRARLSPASHQLGKPTAAPATAPAGTPASDAAMGAQVAPLTPAQIQTVAKMKGVAPVMNDTDFDKLPSGARFIGPDGRIRTKP